MASNKDKLLESAQKYIVKGQVDRAIKDYQQVVALDPKETRHRQKLAELLVRAGRNTEAVGEYETIGKFYAENGYFLKGIAVYKQIQKLTPENINITLTLASLNGKQGLTGNALDEYRIAVDYYEKSGRLIDAIKTIEQMLELDPDNASTRQKYAEILLNQGERDKAFEIYSQLADLLKTKGNTAACEKINARISSLFPDRVEFSLDDLAALIQSDTDNAIIRLSGLIKKDNSNIDLWKLLVEGYRKKNDDEKLRLTFDLMIRMFPGELAAREGVILCALKEQRIADGVDLLGKHAPFFISQSAYVVLESLYLQFREIADDQALVEGLKQLYIANGDAQKLAQLQASIPAQELADNSAGESILGKEQVPASPEASDVATSGENNYLDDDLTDSWEEEVHIAVDEPDDLLSSLDNKFIPAEEETLLDDDLLTEEDVLTEEDLLPDEDVLLAEAELDEAEIDSEALDLELVEDEPAELPSAALELSLDDADDLDLVETTDELPALSIYGEMEEADDLILDADPDNQLELEEFDLLENEDLVLEPEEEDNVPELSLTTEMDLLLGSDRDEIDLDISKGMDQLFEQFDDLLTLEQEPVIEGKAVKYSWDGMFSGADDQAALGDAETHFDLGIAYKEMGLFDDAITEFKHASVSPARRLDCLSLQAACYREKNEYDRAERLLLDEIHQAAATGEELLGLKYELGLLYEISDRPDEALALFLEIRAVNPEFHGVSEKIRSLQGEGDSFDLVDLDLEELEALEEISS